MVLIKKGQILMKDLTKGNEGKLILKFAIPMLLGNVFQQLYNLVDSIIIGNYLGKEAFSAVGASFPIFFALISLVIGIASGTTIIIAQNFGAKKFEKVRQAIDTMYIVLFFASVLIAIVGLSFNDEIFALIKLPEEIIPQAKKYFNIVVGGSVVMFGLNGTSATLRGLGDSKTPLYFLILATILNIGLDFLFVLGFDWGIEGVAIATVIAQGVAFFSAIFYLNRTHEIVSLSIKKIKFNYEIFVQSMKIGLPSGFQQMFVALGMMAMYRIVNGFGTNTITAYTAAGRIDAFAMMPAMNFAQALTPFVGQNLGAGKLDRVKKGLFATLLMTSIVSILFSGIAFLFGENLMAIFNPDETEVIAIGYDYLVIVASFYIIFSAMFSIGAVFRGAGDTIVPMFITLFSLWIIRIPISYFLSQEIGENGIWWGIPIAWCFGATFSLFYYFSGRWKRKKVVNV